MYMVIACVEKVLRGVRIILKLAYYKVKYGKRIKIGKDVHFRKGFIVNIAKNGRLEIGDKTFFNNNCSINCHNEIIIGRNNLFGEAVKIYDHNHVFNDKSVSIERTFKDGRVKIGDRNWFGSNAVILSKAKIGDNNVFGAGVVVNADYGSDLLVRQKEELAIKKIIYK